MKQYICLASAPWQSIPTRTQQLMARLKDAQILYFEPPASREHRTDKKPGRRVRPNLTVYTLPPILDVEERHTYLFRRNQNKLARYIEQTMRRHRFRDPLLWCTCPWQVHLLDYLPYRGLVYDCDREWTHFPLRWESDLALEADVIFAASLGLVDRLAPCSDNIALIPNGANYAMFSQGSTQCPPELQGLNCPVLGYAGTIWRDLSLAPVQQAARTHPSCAFLLIGRVEENPLVPVLQSLPNVAFLGLKSPVELPDYLNHFDVCLNLPRMGRPKDDVLSSRVYEYLSTGNPIVSMLHKEQVECFPDVIYNAYSPKEFAQLCTHALSEVGDWARRRRQDYGAANSWSCRAEEITRILETIGLG